MDTLWLISIVSLLSVTWRPTVFWKLVVELNSLKEEDITYLFVMTTPGHIFTASLSIITSFRVCAVSYTHLTLPTS